MTQVVSTGTQTLGSFLPVLWKLPSTEYLEDLSEEFMIFEQGNIERDVVNQDPDSQIIISSYYKPVKVKKVTQYKSDQS
ncbi:hypothetical protein KUTeg_006377 [Tegillarca granosa]|uniref:Uncharacterized protein n=1 Tax=Tegillarca granosa TaxID=220873 RepID=A0ABQ9FKW2_TEGGR|nr:hypothetical protein KUTeg_006377 [Tegillarca granosa]